MSSQKYKSALRAAHSRLLAQIEEDRGIRHSAETGRKVEARVREALREVLPPKVGVSHGFVVDSLGGESKQMDIVLYDKYNTPRVQAGIDPSDAEVFPVESTFACGEVKTRLTATELRDCFAKCDSYKSLTRRAYFDDMPQYKPPIKLFGKTMEYGSHWESIFFCIAVSGTNLGKLKGEYDRIVADRQLGVKQRIDTIVNLEVAEKGNLLINSEPTNIHTKPGLAVMRCDLLPDEQTTIEAYGTDAPWSMFVNLLLEYMASATADPVQMGYYLSGEL